MRTSKLLVYRRCPLCDRAKYKTKYYKNYNIKDLEMSLFSARRERKKKTYEHNTFVKCVNCGMIYANPILNPSVTEKLYKESEFNYGDQEDNLKTSYGAFLRHAKKYFSNGKNLLDIGAGNGFFLTEALNQGYINCYGVEPSKQAIRLANEKVKENIINGPLKDNQFKSNFFDIITIFQTIDHLEYPNEALSICNNYLKKGGLLLCISHDVDSLSSKIMGERSPIFDIEHTQLFSKRTISEILRKNGFEVLEIINFSNKYSLRYIIKLSPLSKPIKKLFIKIFKSTNLLDKKMNIRLGNFGVIARKN
ncbi:MAG: class I SAM-dependent methyltransferase [Nanoarchaeota archaeon]|nr:class I SAM-dependent methyltransferase [Nanoarchaeota archaeon]